VLASVGLCNAPVLEAPLRFSSNEAKLQRKKNVAQPELRDEKIKNLICSLSNGFEIFSLILSLFFLKKPPELHKKRAFCLCGDAVYVFRCPVCSSGDAVCPRRDAVYPCRCAEMLYRDAVY